MKIRFIRFAIALAAGVSLTLGSASAQNYPIRPIALVVPFAAGSTTDILGRILAGKLSESIGQRVIVDNRGGAGGSIGTEYVARAPPDGYTIMLGTVSTHAINASIYSRLSYDPIKDFAPVIEFGAVPQVLVVNSSMPIRSVQELIEYARARPGRVTYGSAGNGTTNHLSGALLGAKEKLQMVHVPYRGGAQAITDLLANEIVFMFYPYAALLPYIKAETLRALGTTAKIEALPDVPTLAEAKLADFRDQRLVRRLRARQDAKADHRQAQCRDGAGHHRPGHQGETRPAGHRSRLRHTRGACGFAEGRSGQMADRGGSGGSEIGLNRERVEASRSAALTEIPAGPLKSGQGLDRAQVPARGPPF